MAEPIPDDDTVCLVERDGSVYAFRLGLPDKEVGPFADAAEASLLAGPLLDGWKLVYPKSDVKRP